MKLSFSEARETVLNIASHFKGYLDVISLTTLLATLTAWLPPLAALVSLVWGLIRIYETTTVQRWVRKRQSRRPRVRSKEA